MAVAEDTDRIITETELLANASDADGDALSVTGLAISSGNGTLVDNNDGTFTYTPDANDDTEVTFEYTISDASTQPSTHIVLAGDTLMTIAADNSVTLPALIAVSYTHLTLPTICSV